MDFKLTGIHGGDIYRNHVELDFSVNVNPLGIPKEAKTAIHEAVNWCDRYPDMEAEKLKEAVSRQLSVPEEFLLFGNGSSELFLAVIHGLWPKKIVIPVPSFYGYAYAAEAQGGEVIYYKTRKEDGFRLTGDFLKVLTKDVKLIFLANPNNPTGVLMDREILGEILRRSEELGIYVVLDECFIEFCRKGDSILDKGIESFSKNLILVRAFTKIYSIPGVRLGYLVCSNQALLERIKRQLPEWNLSCFAQAAGCACAGQTEYIKETAAYVEKERRFLEAGLERKGFLVFPSAANFILFYSKTPIYEQLLERGILIRDCGNFKGLTSGFYRIAVRSREENERLLGAI